MKRMALAWLVFKFMVACNSGTDFSQKRGMVEKPHASDAMGDKLDLDPQTVTLEVNPSILSIDSSSQQQFTVVTNPPALPLKFTWTLEASESSQKNLGTIGDDGLYTAMETIVEQIVQVKALAEGYPSLQAIAYILVRAKENPLSMRPATAIIPSGATQSFVVSNSRGWKEADFIYAIASVSDTATGAENLGSIDAQGLYQAPVVLNERVVQIIATSRLEPGLKVSALVKVSPVEIKLALNPREVTLASGERHQFTALVSGYDKQLGDKSFGVKFEVAPSEGGKDGSISSDGLFTAPLVSGESTVTIVASVVERPGVKATALIKLVPLMLSIKPNPAEVLSLGSLQLKSYLASSGQEVAASYEIVEASEPFIGTLDSSGLLNAPLLMDGKDRQVKIQARYAPESGASELTASTTVNVKPLRPQLALKPSRASVASSAQLQFDLAMDTPNLAVEIVWSLNGLAAEVGTISPDGLYTAPQAFEERKVIVLASIKGYEKFQAQAEVLITPEATSFSLEPKVAHVGSAQSLVLQVLNNRGWSSQDFTFSVEAAAGANLAGVDLGSIDGNGVYQAPLTLVERNLTIIASHRSDPSLKTSALITVDQHSVGLRLDPADLSIKAGHSATIVPQLIGLEELKPNVVYRLKAAADTPAALLNFGSITPAGVYTAPIVYEPTSLLIEAQLVEQAETLAVVPVHIAPPSLLLSPSEVALVGNATNQFRVSFDDPVAGAPMVDYTLSSVDGAGAVGSITAEGLYTAPVVSVQSRLKLTAKLRAAPTRTAVAYLNILAPSQTFLECNLGSNLPIFGQVYSLPNTTTVLPNFAQLTPLSEPVCLQKFALPAQSWEAGFAGDKSLQEWFGIKFQARLDAPEEGSYSLRLVSDDGTKLFIDGKLVIDNDGTHGPTHKDVTLPSLAKGSHDLVLEYFQGPRFQIALELYWVLPSQKQKDPNSPYSYIPNEVFLPPLK